MGTAKVGRYAASIAVLVLSSMVAPMNVEAASKKVPGKPKIVVVETTARSKNRVNIRVRIELPRATRKLPITGSEVRYGGRSCKMSKKRTTCVLRNLPQNAMIQRMQARSKNKNGFGKYSASLRVMTMPNKWIRAGYTSMGTKVPQAIKAVGNTRLLANSGNQKWNKMQALPGAGVGSAAVRSMNAYSQTQPTITFRTDGVVGLATADGTVSGVSGLYAVRSDGSAIDAVVSGSANIQDFYVAPNGRYYVVFRSPTEIAAGQPSCVLAEVDADTGNPRCVDFKLASVYNLTGFMGMNIFQNPAIQFDDNGNIYYMGNLYTSVDSCAVGTWCEQTWRPTLRKSVNGSVVTLLSEFATNFDFLVQGDGSVMVTGQTNATGATWTRRVSATGGLSNIDATSRAQFLTRFADGNVYFGLATGPETGIRRFITASATLDPKWWIRSSYSFGSEPVESHFSPSALCSNSSSTPMMYCASVGSGIKFVHNFGSTHTLAVAGTGMNSSQLVQYYPSPELIKTSMANITVAEKVGDKIALAGTTAAGVNSLILYDPVTFQETIVVDESNQIEVYSLAYVASTRKLMFNGLDFATNRYVMGEIAIP